MGRDNESDQVESKKSSYDVSVPSAPAPQLEGGSSPPKPVVNQSKLNLDALNKQREDAESERLSPHAQPSDRPSTKASSQAELVLPVFALPSRPTAVSSHPATHDGNPEAAEPLYVSSERDVSDEVIVRAATSGTRARSRTIACD